MQFKSPFFSPCSRVLPQRTRGLNDNRTAVNLRQHTSPQPLKNLTPIFASRIDWKRLPNSRLESNKIQSTTTDPNPRSTDFSFWSRQFQTLNLLSRIGPKGRDARKPQSRDLIQLSSESTKKLHRAQRSELKQNSWTKFDPQIN